MDPAKLFEEENGSNRSKKDINKMNKPVRDINEMIKSIKATIDELIEDGATTIMFEAQCQDIKFNTVMFEVQAQDIKLDTVITSFDEVLSPAKEKCLTVDAKDPSGKDVRTIIPFSAIKLIKMYAV